MNLALVFAQFGRNADSRRICRSIVVWRSSSARSSSSIVLVLLSSSSAYGKLWFQAYMSNARVSMFSLIGMSLRQVNARVIVQAKIMAMQAGSATTRTTGITTRRLEAHYLAGGNVPGVIRAIIAAHRADIDLDFDRAAAIDLAGRDVLDAVQTSVNPKVIDCPDPRLQQVAPAQRHRQERRRAEGAGPRDRADEPRAAHRRRDRRDDHRPRRRGHHHLDRLGREPPAR